MTGGTPERARSPGSAAAGRALLVAALAAAPARSQASAPPEIDPYTRGAPEALAHAGYRSFGPFLFGGFATENVERELGNVPVLWVETQHFRLGSTLEAYRPVAAKENEELRAELARLRDALPGVPQKPKTLDPWLRLHLFARRLEDLHADFRATLGVADAASAGEQDGGELRLGMKEKQLVFLAQDESTLARFTRAFCGAESTTATIHFFEEDGALFFGVADAKELELGDSELHYALVFGVAQNLACAIDGFTHELPRWWLCGLGFHFARRAEPRVMLYARRPGEALPPEELADWEPLVRGRVEGGIALSWEEMLERADWSGQPFGDSVVLWSRTGFLLGSRHRDELLATLYADVPRDEEPPRVRQVFSLAQLEREWSEHVLATYRKKRR